MRILLTNDDGIFAPGIQTLWKALRGTAELYVAAPANQQSAKSQALTVHEPIRVDLFDAGEAITAWKIGGTPADCVKLALESLMMKNEPDIIISGINLGPNIGNDVLYSGTVGAAIEGALHGIVSVAVSLDVRSNPNFSNAADYVLEFIEKLKEFPTKESCVYNINVPKDWQKGDGMAITRLGGQLYENVFEERKDPSGRSYYWMGGEIAETFNADDTDIAVLHSGKVSLTPLHFNMTDEEAFRELQEWSVQK